MQSLDALRQGALEDHVKGEFVVIGGESLSLAFSGIAEFPVFLEKDLFLVGLAATGGSASGEMPAEGFPSVGSKCENRRGKKKEKKIKKVRHTKCATFPSRSI